MSEREPLCLLILDDEEAIGLILARIATRRGWAVQVTATVAAFKAQFQAVRPDAIMLDLNLGTVDGVEQLRFLHDRQYRGSIVLMSGFADRVLHAASELGKSLGLAMVDVLSKPASNDQIRDLLDTLALHQSVERSDPVAARSEPAEPETLSAAHIDQGLTRGEFGLVFQPIVNAVTRHVEVLEALARWRHPTRGLVMPDEFIPIAEQSNDVIDRFTRWVVRTAGEEARRLHRLGLPASVAVNVSAKNLRFVDFPDRLLELVTDLGLPPSAMTLEITESAATGDPTVTKDILARLRLKGFRLAMDDFGTGFSSLKALLNSPFSELKIDKSFVANLLTSRDARAIARSVARLAFDMGLRTVAEGAETQEVVDQLLEFGVDSLQGYYISRPLHPDQLPAWLAGWPRAA